MSGIRFLSIDDVPILHADTIARDGGLAGLRELGLLESAVAMPRAQFDGAYLHPDLPAMAGAYLSHITRNHPFVDGNKRAGVLAALVYLDANGVSALPAPASLEKVTLSVADGSMSKERLIAWFRVQLAESGSGG